MGEPTSWATKLVAGPVVDVFRRAHLDEDAVVQHADAVRHGQRLDLIVGHEEGRAALGPLQMRKLDTQRLAQLGIQVRQRLVHQVGPRAADDGAADGDAVHLAAG